MWFPDRYRRRFDRLIQRGNASGAAALARRHTIAFPEDETGWQNLGQAAVHGGDLLTAAKAYEQALAVNSSPWNVYDLAETLIDEGNTAKARLLLEPLASSEDTTANLLAHMGLAAAAKKQRRWVDAVAHARIAEGLIPLDKPVWNTKLGAILADIPGEEAWAERLLREAIKGGEARAYVALAVLIEDRDPDEAADYLQLARRRWPGSPRELDRYLPALRKHRKEIRDLGKDGATNSKARG
jgi:tetratricopeptide (TPR) repeat protein